MTKILLTSPHLTVLDINRCIETFESLKEQASDSRLEIEANQELKAIDFRLFSYFILFKTENPDIHLTLNLRKNKLKAGTFESTSLAVKIVQCGIMGFLQTKEPPFEVYFSDMAFKNEYKKNKKNVATFNVTENPSSFDFVPYLSSMAVCHLLVQQEKMVRKFDPYKTTFMTSLRDHTKTPLDRIPEIPINNFELNDDLLYQIIAQTLLTGSKSLGLEKYFVSLGRLAFYRTLQIMGVLGLYFRRNMTNTLSEGDTVSMRQLPVIPVMAERIISELSERPLFYQFLTSQLFENLKKYNPAPGNSEEFVNKFYDLWGFVKDLGYSLTELTRNCLNHSTSATGVISFMVTNEMMNSNKLQEDNPWDAYKEFIFENADAPTKRSKSFLQIYVSDLGKKGVVNTLRESFDQNIPKESLELLEADLLNIGRQDFTFKNLLVYDSENMLNIQSKRAIAHLGLLIFGRQVQENNGLLLASTRDIAEEQDSVMIIAGKQVKNPFTSELVVSYGTNYLALIPVDYETVKLQSYLPQSSTFAELTTANIEGLEKLLDYELLEAEKLFSVRISDHEKILIVILRPELFGITGGSNQDLSWSNLFEKIRELKFDGRFMVCIDLDKISEKISENDLFRILGNWQILLPQVSLIVSNLPYQKFERLIQINDWYCARNPALDFWNTLSATLFYSYAVVDDKRFYFVDALFGKKRKNFLELNRIISRNNFNLTTLTAENFSSKEEDVPSVDLSDANPAFFNGDSLLPLDLLLEASTGITLFESNTSVVLNNELKVKSRGEQKKTEPNENDQKIDVITIIRNLSGFKISDSHFRLGSKIHISHFYYAKRFFQNSFFASRFAFVLSHDILQTIKQNEYKDSVYSHGLTLIGYGMYSELMISLIEKLIWKKLSLSQRSMLNHNIVSDFENLSFFKGNKESGFGIKKNVVIIVPIATTFSTAVKIEEEIKRLFGNENYSRVIGPHLNVLHITNGSIINQAKRPGKLEASFGWTKIDRSRKVVEVRAFYLDNKTSISNNIEQKYYMALESKWHLVESCEHCFPMINKLKERPLFETDATSVTPSLIFDFPKGREIGRDDLTRDVQLDSDVIRYGHHTRNNGHFLYSIDSEEFLKRNEDVDNQKNNVTKWLLKVKIDINFNRSDHVLLVTTCHYSNASFINLVNEVVFSSTANIIHYDPSNDYIQNFEIIYGEEIARADKLVFVDDSLKSGNSFSKIYDFVHYAKFKKEPETRFSGISACIVLINKAQESTERFIRSKLEKSSLLFSFANLHLFTSLNHDEISPLVVEEERYQLLSKNSFLDAFKVHFLKQSNKLKSDNRQSNVNKKERYLNMLKATHGLYQYFSQPFNSKELKDFYTFRHVLSKQEHRHSIMLSEVDEDALLKVLTQSPFLQYKPLKIQVFKWVLHLLQSHIDDTVIVEINGNVFSVESFKKLKFLIRRAGLLKSNILISKYFIDFLEILHGEQGIKKLIKESDGDDRMAFKYFNIFYAAQVKELLLHNEARAFRIEAELVKRKNIKNTPSRFVHLFRILRIENSIVIQKFYELLRTEPEWMKLYTSFDQLHSISPIRELLKQGVQKQHPKYLWLQAFQKVASVNRKGKLWESELLTNYIWIRRFLEFDDSYRKESLEEKTNVLFERLKILVGSNPNREKKVGAFFYVKTAGPERKDQGFGLAEDENNDQEFELTEDENDGKESDLQEDENDGKNDYHLVYDKNHEGIGEIDREYLKPKTFLRNFLNKPYGSERGYQLSIVELGRNGKTWIDLYEVEEEIIFKINDAELPGSIVGDQYNRIILVRINKRINNDTERAQGVIGLYFNAEDDDITDLNLTRYLHLLRDPFSNFIERHHENNEFRDWSIADARRRLNVLYGHGRETLIELANNEPTFKKIVLTLEEMRHMVLSEMSSNQFKKFYGIPHVIDKKYFNSLLKMADLVYSSKYIEEPVVYEPVPEIYLKNSFHFNRNILDWICFELFVNAKKNRWIFFPGEFVEINGKSTNKNHLQITIIAGKTLQIVIRNTAPHVNDLLIDILNTPDRDIKKNQDSSGTSLIKSVSSTFLTKSEIKFQSVPIDINTGLSWFTVTLSLSPM